MDTPKLCIQFNKLVGKTMKGKILKISALIMMLGFSVNSSAESYNNITVKLGSFTLGSQNQTVITAETFDTSSSGVFSVEYERKFGKNLTYGGELIRYKNTYDSGTSSATATHVFANIKKYFDVATHVKPFIGAGAGVSSASLTGSTFGTVSGFGVQFNAGIKFPFDEVSAVIEYKTISAEPDDAIGQSVDISGDGLFAGLAINF